MKIFFTKKLGRQKSNNHLIKTSFLNERLKGSFNLDMTNSHASVGDAKAAIIEAAIAEFCTTPFRLVSMRRLASRASVNHSMLYYYFGSKERLYKLAMRKLKSKWERSNAAFAERVSSIAKSGNCAAAKEFIADEISERALHSHSEMSDHDFEFFCENLKTLLKSVSKKSISDFECSITAVMLSGIIFASKSMDYRENLCGSGEKIRDFIVRILDRFLG